MLSIHRIRNLALILTAVVAATCSPPSDASLQKRFVQHQATFDELVKMLKADRQVKWIWLSSVKPEGFLTEARVHRYRKLMTVAGLWGLYADHKSGRFELLPAQSIFSPHIQKSYVYSEEALTPLHESLDSTPEGSKPYVPQYSRISENWYIEYMDLRD
jgi:hypothetical protein